jgi:hypothetical protein
MPGTRTVKSKFFSKRANGISRLCKMALRLAKRNLIQPFCEIAHLIFSKIPGKNYFRSGYWFPNDRPAHNFAVNNNSHLFTNGARSCLSEA